MRYATFKSNGGLMQGFNGAERNAIPVWYSHGGEQFRREWFADETPDGPRINHTGWFCDVHQEETARGIVARLPHGRYIAGYWMSVNGERVYYPTLFDSARDAAMSADGLAERLAENEREYSERWNAANKLSDGIDSALNRLRECLALRNNACFTALREEAHELMSSIRADRETLATEYKGMI
jgi:hypothetical protein